MSKSIGTTERFEPRDGLVLEEIDDEVVVLDLQQNSYFGLNEVAKQVWKGLEDGLSIGEIVDQLDEQFAVERDELFADVCAFVSDALCHGLITRTDES
ncbi:PqqD family protein [Persicimonas caeni]|uniref:PqqD family protein n=1 Tax=Persicimonas caeni TaxID=2292766 RepID=A0A4Y6PWD4_PERCE|nr:PqqD family protein [Persicimonas caeni]QDG52628.1 PqqD family protein [Persicimonas caeni]QED33850.1 PqqD family protein [Persicimonas caeni]